MATEAASVHPVETVIKVSPPPPPELRADPEPFRPWLTPAIVAANIAVFVVTMYVNDCPGHSESCILMGIGRFSFQPMKQNPLLGPSANTLVKMGALEVTKVVHGHQGWRLITCMWLHAGVFHLLANMLSLVFIGIRLEQEFGFVRIGLLYLISGFGGSLLSALFVQTSISVGASGALFGLLGAMLSELITNWTIYSNKIAALLTLMIITVINLAVGILPHVDNFAHIGGFVSGFCLGFVFLIRPQYRWVNQRNVPLGYRTGPVRKHKVYQYILWLIAAIVLTAGFTVGILMLFRGYSPNDHCSWCHYLSCVPTSLWHCNKTTNLYCLVSQTENQYNLTCEDSGRFRTYMLPNASNTRVQEMCMQLCT